MTGNANFTQPDPTLTAVTVALDALEGANTDAANDRATAQTKTPFLHGKEAALDKVLAQLGNYVENKPDGDAVKIRSAGLDVAGDTAPVRPKPQVLNLIATTGDAECEIDLGWDSMRGAASYEIQRNTDPKPAATWVAVASSAQTTDDLSPPNVRRFTFRRPGFSARV